MYSAIDYANRRQFERKPCRLPADLDDYENAFSGQVRNLSKGGAFVQATVPGQPSIGRELIMTIPFKGNSDYLIIKAKVAWVRPDGLGLEFIKNIPLN